VLYEPSLLFAWGCHDAIKQIKLCIQHKAKYVLDTDISKCFDGINHEELLQKINMNGKVKRQIKAWLKSGVIDAGVFNETLFGTPQGGVLSPLLANIALHGIELINILQLMKKVSLETLATALPIPIRFESRRKKIQRFLSLPNFKIEKIWFPIVTTWLEANFTSEKIIYVVIDRTNWACVNLFMVSVVWDKRAFPVYFELLPKLGCSQIDEQKLIISKVLPLFNNYKICVLADREFCSVKLANWLREMDVYFCLRLKKNHFIEQQTDVWLELKYLGLSPGISLFLQCVKVTKTQGFTNFNVACKWKRKILGVAPEEGWFILTNLNTLELAIASYKKRFDIEEMFRDFKKGGYNMEDTNVSGERLISLVLLIALAKRLPSELRLHFCHNCWAAN
jgi:Reverse transcriptase (RNA-dependent DNA polymerase)/Transposase DDE domain